MAEVAAVQSYPVTFEIEYPERLSRWTTFFRVFLFTVLIFPLFYAIALLLALAALPFIGWVSIMSNGRYPRLLFPIAVWAQRLSAQLSAYSYLVTDEFPFDEADRPVRFDIEYRAQHGRMGAFFLPILVIPHLIIVYLIGIVVLLTTIIGWFAILITGSYPRGLWGFSVGYQRWSARVNAYSAYLTDRYPPFSMEP